MFKLSEINTYAENSTLIGDIGSYNNKPSVHTHINLATEDGIVHGGHLLEAFIEPTLDVMRTVENYKLKRKLDPEYGITVITP